jgi:hypothetical protein
MLSWPSRVAAPHVIFISVETQVATSCVAANATLQHQASNRAHIKAASLGRVIYHVVNMIYHSRYCRTADVARPRSRPVLKCDLYLPQLDKDVAQCRSTLACTSSAG